MSLSCTNHIPTFSSGVRGSFTPPSTHYTTHILGLSLTPFHNLSNHNHKSKQLQQLYIEKWYFIKVFIHKLTTNKTVAILKLEQQWKLKSACVKIKSSQSIASIWKFCTNFLFMYYNSYTYLVCLYKTIIILT